MQARPSVVTSRGPAAAKPWGGRLACRCLRGSRRDACPTGNAIRRGEIGDERGKLVFRQIELRHLHQQIRPVRRALAADCIGQRRVVQLVAHAVQRRRRHRRHQRGQLAMCLGNGGQFVLQGRQSSRHTPRADFIRRRQTEFACYGTIHALPLMARQAIELHQQIAPAGLRRKLPFARPRLRIICLRAPPARRPPDDSPADSSPSPARRRTNATNRWLMITSSAWQPATDFVARHDVTRGTAQLK